MLSSDPSVFGDMLTRTFKIRLTGSNGVGTGFGLGDGGRQYLVTAAHVLTGFSGVLEVERYNTWVPHAGRLVGISGQGDVGVLALDTPLVYPTPVVPDTHAKVSERLFFLGFPFAQGTGDRVNEGNQIPYVKAGIVSALMNDGGVGSGGFYLDALNNPGFSGGPVISGGSPPRILGIVSAGMLNPSPTFDPSGKAAGYTNESSGLVFCYGIELALDLIRKNPIGPLQPARKP